MSLTVGPERYSAPPVETWTIPSLPASAKPARAAFSVCEEETLIAGKAKDFALAVSSISAYFSGLAIGMAGLLRVLGVTSWRVPRGCRAGTSRRNPSGPTSRPVRADRGRITPTMETPCAVPSARSVMPAQPPRPDRRRRARTVLVALGLVAAVLLGGCGGSGKEKEKGADKAAGPTPSASASTSRSSSAPAEPAADPGYGAPKVGDCHRMSRTQSVASVDTSARVSCKHAHTSVVAYVGYRPKPVTPATPGAQRRALAKKLCQPAYQWTVEGPIGDRATSILTWTL